MKITSTFFVASVFVLLITFSCQATGASTSLTEGSVKVTKTKNEIIKVSYLVNEEKVIYVRVVDGRGRVINRNYINNETGFVKAFNFEKLKAGTYTVEVFDKGHLLASEEVIVPVSQ